MPSQRLGLAWAPSPIAPARQASTGPPSISFLTKAGRCSIGARHPKAKATRRRWAPKRLKAADGAPPAAQLVFTLRMDAGGPTGPLVNAMLGPALLPAAEDLANKIAAHVEKLHAAKQEAA